MGSSQPPSDDTVPLTPKILTSKILHENGDIFKNALSKKGLE
jgi:hypothetical protein